MHRVEGSGLNCGDARLGLAMQESGTAALVAEPVLGSIADFGPLAAGAGRMKTGRVLRG